jgi:hypothetical protein
MEMRAWWKAGAVGLLSAVCLVASTPAEADGTGWLTVTVTCGQSDAPCNPPADIALDGTDLGVSSLTHYQLAIGHHDLRFIVAGKHARKMGVVITDGEETTLTVNM